MPRHPRLQALGLTVPPDFPVQPYQQVLSHLAPRLAVPSAAHTEFLAAWNAIVYRFRAVADHDHAFRKHLQRYGAMPSDPLNRYVQERELFNFYVNGLSALESLSYAVFFLGALALPSDFPVSSDKDRRAIKPLATVRKFRRHFPTEVLTEILVRVFAVPDPTYEEWTETRNILAHRTQPPRLHYVGGENDGKTVWQVGSSPVADSMLTSVRRTWLSQTLDDLLRAIESFVTARL
jgi:hypothetical protein